MQHGCTKICECCGNSYSYARGGECGYKYCSPDCQKKAIEKSQQMARDRYYEQHPPKLCQCGNEFRGTTKTMCKECHQKVHLYGTEKACVDCGATFNARKKETIRCRTCRKVYELARRSSARERLHRGHSGLPVRCESGKIGAIAESMFDVLCARLGWQSSRPMFETNPGWDRIVIISEQMQRIQVKGTANRSNSLSFNLGRASNAIISPETCDRVALVDVCTGDIWLIRSIQIGESFDFAGEYMPINCVAGTDEYDATWKELAECME